MLQIFSVKFLVLWITSLNICLTYCMADRPCNEYLDNFLSHMKSEKDFFIEPYEIPDSQKSFAIYQLEFGYVYGLNTLHRIQDVEIIKKGETPYIKVYLGAGEMKINSKVKRKFLSFGKSANVDANIPLIEMELDIIPQSGTELVIKNFKVDQVKGLKVKVSGAGFLKDLAYNAFLSAFGRFFKNTIKNTFEEKLTSFLADKVIPLTIPEECLNDGWE